MHKRARSSSFILHPSAFTLVELLVVIGIIGVLVAILFPVISKVRQAAYETDSRALVTSIEGACQAYFQDFKAYPGPLSRIDITSGTQTPIYTMPTGTTAINLATVDTNGNVTGNGGRITGTENAVLGLIGGLYLDRTIPNAPIIRFDPSSVSQGASSLSTLRPGRTPPYLQTANLSAGQFSIEGGGTKDTVIPEFVDKFPSGPLPILILRAQVGGARNPDSTAALNDKNNNVVINRPYTNADGTTLFAQYNLIEITPYTQFSLGTGKPSGLQDVKPVINLNGKAQPFDGLTYLADPTTYDVTQAKYLASAKARKTDTIILISAGKDRVYGTADDITNFGSVLP